MKNLFTIGVLLTLSAIMISCQEDKIHVYNGPDAISISTEFSRTFSFLSVPKDHATHDFILRLTAMGYYSDRDRTVRLSVGDSTTATPQMYNVPSTVTMPAGEYIVAFPVTIIRDGVEETGSPLLIIRIEPSEDFALGLSTNIRLTFTKEYPTSWYSSGPYYSMLGYYMGKCDKAKYEFVYEFLGTVDLVDWSDGFGTQTSILTAALNAAITAYNAANPGNTLKDSSGMDMWFSPST